MANQHTIVVLEPITRVIEVAPESFEVVKEIVYETIEIGLVGPQGIPGPQGEAADASFQYIHDQIAASTTWVIVHNLNGFPNVSVVDSAGTNVEGEIHYDSANQLTVSFTVAFSGKAYLS